MDAFLSLMDSEKPTKIVDLYESFPQLADLDDMSRRMMLRPTHRLLRVARAARRAKGRRMPFFT